MEIRKLALLGLVCQLALSLSPTAASADWLVTAAGERIETQGPWKLKGNVVVFTLPNGTLSSIRASELDLEASRRATEAPPEAGAPEPAPPTPPPADPVLVITDRDVGKSGGSGILGSEQLLERFRDAHGRRDLAALMRLVNLTGAVGDAERLVREQMEWVVQHEIASMEVVPIGPGDVTEYTRGGVTYRPNVEVTGKLQIELEPTDEFDEASMSFQIGRRLGSYFIGVAAPVSP